MSTRPSKCSPKRPNAVRREQSADRASFNRRSFLGKLGTAAAATVAAGVTGFPPFTGTTVLESEAEELGPLKPKKRRSQAYRVRQQAAKDHVKTKLPDPIDNGDEALYANKIGSFTKGLPHNAFGEVDLKAYEALLAALASGNPSDFEAVPMGCTDPSNQRRLVNPQAGLAFDLEGYDSHALTQPPAPAFASAEEAGEMVEDYWMALLRDVPFDQYDTHPLAQQAASDLSALSDFRGPKIGGEVTTGTLFRGLTPGDLTGPYLSQFFWLPAPFGANYVEQRMATAVAGLDYVTTFAEWLEIQNGCEPSDSNQFEPTRRYLINGRDLGQWVHVDVLFQAYFVACLCMSDMGVPVNPGNPYLASATQDGFGTFGPPHFKVLLAEVATRALKAVWFQKWYVHRRVRPEAFAGCVHLNMANFTNYPIHHDVFNSAALPLIFDHNSALNGGEGTYLLPMAFPEGSPVHPAYGAGHGTVAGACVTILKALFDETYVIPNAVVPNADGSALLPYDGPSLTIGGELNKLASNIALGRNIAGVHWRSDGIESMKLGEQVAIGILQDQRATYNEDFGGFTFTKFDGTQVTV